MYDIRLRLMADDGTTKRKVLQADNIMLTHNDSASPTLSFTVSEKVAGRMDAPVVVAVEYSTGGTFVQPRNGLFMVSADDSDDADTSGTVRFTGIGFVPWMLARTYLHWSASAKNGQRQWIQFPSGKTGSATPGHTLNGMLTESKARGWGPMVSWDFTATKDSAGVNWSTAGGSLWWSAWPLLTPLTRVVEQMSTQGYMDWWTEGTKLRMFRPGTGVLRDNIVLGGPKFSARPVKSTFDDVFTHLTVVPEKARYWLYLTNTGASARFGRLEATMTQSGVESHEAATASAQPVLSGGRATKREYSFDWAPATGGPLPFGEFNVGDVVTSKTRHGKNQQRVIGIQVSKSGSLVSARAIVGEKLVSLAKKQIQRTSAATIGGTIGGNGVAIPVSTGATFPSPAAPTGLHIVSNTAVWREDGTAQATVKLEWDAVTQAEDGSGVDVADYQVSARLPDGTSSIFATTEALDVTVSSWIPGATYLVKVRARSVDGNESEWSSEIPVIPLVPSSIVPKPPTGLAVTSNTGAFLSDGRAIATVVVSWNAVTSSIEDAPVSIAEYEVTIGQETQRVTGLSATFTVPTGSTVDVRVRALTTIGVWGDLSTVLNVTGAAPVQVTTPPTPPTLTTGAGGVFIFWDGLLTSGPLPFGAQGAFAEYRVGTTGPFDRVSGPISDGPGQVGQVRPNIGDVVQVRLRWVDTLGRVSNVSDQRQITVKGIDLPDLDSAVTDAIDEALAASESADGKVTISPDAPTADDAEGKPVGALWWRRSGTGTVIGLWELTSFGWVARPFDETMVPQINIGLGTYGELDGVRLKAKSVLAESMVIASLGNLIPNGGFSDGLAGWYGTVLSQSTAVTVPDGPDGNTAAFAIRVAPDSADRGLMSTAFAFSTSTTGNFTLYEPGVSYRFRLRARVVSGTFGSVRVRLGLHGVGQGNQWPVVEGTNLDAATATPGAWVELEGTYTTPVGNPRDRLSVSIHFYNAVGTVFEIHEITMRQMSSAKLVVDGSIEARHIFMDEAFADKFWGNEGNFGRISTDMVQPNFGEDLILSAPGAVNILIGEATADMQTTLNEQATALSETQRQATANETAARTANEAASAANIAAAVAQAAAEAAQSQLVEYGKVFTFDEDGFGISAQGSPMSMLLTNANLSFRRDGVPKMWIDEEQVVVPKVKASQVIVGSTVITEKPGGMTWQRL